MSFFKPNITVIDIPSNTYDGLPTVHILHGIHRDDPLHGPGNWAKYFTDAGFPVRIWDYGYVYALNARFFINPHVVNTLIDEIEEGDILLGHSNGCAIIADITDKANVVVGGVILLNPALDVDRCIAEDIPWVHVYCNEGDSAVWWGALLLAHPYGAQGKYGPDFEDKRYKIFKGHTPPNGLPIIDGHSLINNEVILKSWGPFGIQEILKELE